jgi:alpha-tubulin suppressor-like RCC1 family protein
MIAHRRLTLLSSVVILTFLLSLVAPGTAFADDPIPPPPDTTEAAPIDAPPTDAPPTDAAPTELAATEEPPTEAAPTDPAPTDAPAEGELAEVVAAAADAGLVIADSGGEPLVMGSTEAAETLAAGDPSFTIGSTTYNFTFADCDPGAAVTACSNPIQAAIDYLTNNSLLPDDMTIHVDGGTPFTQSVVINIAGLILLGDPGDPLVAGAAWDAPVLHGPGTGTDSVGVTIAAEGVSLIGFIIENWGTAVVQDVIVGTTTTYIENNTIQDNNDGIKFVSEPHGKPGSEVHYNIFQGNLGYAIINAGTPGVGDNNIQDIDASNNYWGCEEGPVVKFMNPDNNNDWDYIVWSEVYGQSNSSNPPIYDDNPNPDCGMLYGRDSLFLHGGNNYKPYKIIIDPIETTIEPYCGDGLLNGDEVCDPTANPTGAPAHYTCNADCTTTYVPYCGDGNIDPGEACDPNAVPTGAPAHYTCNADCTTTYVPYCGDGNIDPGEACDPNAVPTGAPAHYTCNADCTTTYVPYCGDGNIDPGEACDPNAVPTGAPAHYTCNADCTTTYVPYCGDGLLNGDEICDPTANPTGAPAHYTCNADCTTTYVPYCGDGIINQPTEECDGRAGVRDNQVCGSDCRLPPSIGGIGIVSGGIITAGRAHTCAITPAGGVQCWGNNSYGQLGDGSNNVSTAPVDVLGLYGGTDIVAGSDHTCLLAGGSVWCWGMNNKGQLGDGTTTNSNVPVHVLDGVASITAGADYTCAGLLAGEVLCWGNNANGQLADGTTTNRTSPTVATLVKNASRLDGGQRQTCALTPSRAITCWSGGTIPVTGAVPEQNTQVSVSRFGELMIGLDTQGTPVMIEATGATEVSSLSSVIEVDSGVEHVCARLADGSVKCWGANNYGQLGNNSTVESAKPVSVTGLPGAIDLGVGRNHACVIVTATLLDTLIECWGLNLDGQLGNGTTVNSSTPVEVLTDN